MACRDTKKCELVRKVQLKIFYCISFIKDTHTHTCAQVYIANLISRQLLKIVVCLLVKFTIMWSMFLGGYHIICYSCIKHLKALPLLQGRTMSSEGCNTWQIWSSEIITLLHLWYYVSLCVYSRYAITHSVH